MQFYYALDDPKLAKDADGHYKFHLQKFSGVMDPDKNIGANGYSELAGGYLTFSTTLKVPESVMKRAIENLKEKIQAQYSTYKLWKWQSGLPEPNVSPMPIVDNMTSIHKVTKDLENPAPPTDGDNPDAWMFLVQGEGKGTLNTLGSNAFSAMLGQYPVQMIEASAKSGTSQIVVENVLKFKLWTMVNEIRIRGDWDHIYEHFSANLNGKAWFAEADIEVELNKMIKSGGIEVEVKFDEEFVSADDEETMMKAKEAIVKSFTDLAKTTIFDVKQPDVKAAQAGKPKTGLFRPWGVSFAMKYRRDKINLTLDYHEKIDKKISKESKHSANMDGLFDELKNNPEAVERYFSEVFMEEGFRKVHVVANANANWGDGNGDPGDPIHSMSVQIGYPDSQGQIVWKPTARFTESFSDTELSSNGVPAIWTKNTKDRIYVFDFTRHDNGEASEKILVKRTISFKEKPNVFVDEIQLADLETEDHLVEVRANSASVLKIGPIQPAEFIPSEKFKVKIIVKVDGMQEQRFHFDQDNAETPQFLDFWFANQNEIPKWEYKVEVAVQGKIPILNPTVKWETDWIKREGIGDLIADIPPVPSDKMDQVVNYLS